MHQTSKDKEVSPTAGQSCSNTLIAQTEGDGWTSQAPSRRVPKRIRRQKSISLAPRTPIKSAKPSRKKKKNPNHIPRPENSFILFRTDFVRNRLPNIPIPHGQSLSKFVGQAWRCLPEDVRREWSRKASEVSKAHAQKYPGWKYTPARHNRKTKTEEERKIEENSLTFHSTESSPTPVSGTAAIDTILPTSFPSDASGQASINHNTAIATIHPQFIQRKQSLRLSNWDDSVLFSHNYSDSQFYETSNYNTIQPHGKVLPSYASPQPQDWVCDALRRRSSSAPVPDFSALSDSAAVAYRNAQSDNVQANKWTSYFHPTSNRALCLGMTPDLVYQGATLSPMADRGNSPQEHMLTSMPANSPVTETSNVLAGELAQEYSNSQLETTTQHSPSIVQNNSQPQPALSWTGTLCDSPRSMTTTPVMFVSPMQQVSSILHLKEEGDPLFNNPWSGFPSFDSPSPGYVYNAPMLPTPALDHHARNITTDSTRLDAIPSDGSLTPVPSFEELVTANSNPEDLMKCVRSFRFGVPAEIGGKDALTEKMSNTKQAIVPSRRVQGRLTTQLGQPPVLSEDVLEMTSDWGIYDFERYTDIPDVDPTGMNFNSGSGFSWGGDMSLRI